MKTVSILKNIAYTILVAGLSIEMLADEEKKYEKFTDIKDTLLSNEVIIKCSDYDLKYVNGFLRKERFFLKKGLDWKEMKDFEVKDAGVVFHQYSDFPIREVSDLSLTPSIEDPKGNVIHNSRDFFEVNFWAISSPLVFELDIYSMVLHVYNKEEIEAPVEVNESKYIESQKNIGAPNTISISSLENHKILLEAELDVVSARGENPFSDYDEREKELSEEIRNVNDRIKRQERTSEIRKEVQGQNIGMAKEKLLDYREDDLTATVLPGDLNWQFYCK
ncbi:MAG: hypothetical protein ACQEXC_09740 [Pseudomonadota bacterium]